MWLVERKTMAFIYPIAPTPSLLKSREVTVTFAPQNPIIKTGYFIPNYNRSLLQGSTAHHTWLFTSLRFSPKRLLCLRCSFRRNPMPDAHLSLSPRLLSNNPGLFYERKCYFIPSAYISSPLFLRLRVDSKGKTRFILVH